TGSIQLNSARSRKRRIDMTFSVRTARLLLLAAFIACAGWSLGVGLDTAELLARAVFDGRFTALQYAALCYKPLLTVAGAILLAVRIPELACRAGFFPGRVLTLLTCIGIAALWAGASAHFEPAFGYPLGRPPTWGEDFKYVGFTCGLLVVLLIYVVPPPIGAREPYFLTDRSHFGSSDARRCLITVCGHALVVALLIGWALEALPELVQPHPFPRRLFLFGASYALGVGTAALQKYPQRAIGLVPLAAALALIGVLCAWAAPASLWPAWPLGFACGLAHPGARNWLLVTVPDGQRGPALVLAAAAQILGASLGVALGQFVPRPELARVAVLLMFTAFAAWILKRELVEQSMEFILWTCYPIRGYGPGLLAAPTRGPVLVLANHCAWLDPLWLAKVIPLQMRPMMTARFFDMAVIRWLMRRVFYAIRVAEVGFRREAPEIQDAIAAIDRGISVLIFPEGFLKRKEEQSLRRFGQGIYQILREKPRTPVICCWIEGGWGSYTSYFNGPPTKNKKKDIRRHIRIGLSKPEVLSLELLHDHLKTRQYLMRRVLNARAFLGLPVLPAPPFAADEEEE
ncbi:MAG: lysophospholipid acyltransferase family protein, partial [Gemmataceae bacterium]